LGGEKISSYFTLFCAGLSSFGGGHTKHISWVAHDAHVVGEQVRGPGAGEALGNVNPLADPACFEMEVDQFGRPGVSDRTQDISRSRRRPLGDTWSDAVEVPVQEEVLPILAPFVDRVPRDHRRPEERPCVENVRVARLVFKKNELHRFPSFLRQIHATVADRTKRPSAALFRVRTIEIVAAYDVMTPGQARRYGILVAIVVLRAIGPPGDLRVRSPGTTFRAVRIGRLELLWRALFIVR
jgi:hypothetical protein